MAIEALYLHVPFCASKCRYCDFDSAPCRDAGLLAGYAGRLRSCVERLGAQGFLGACRTAYIGGGTPTLLGAGLAEVVRAIRDAAPALEELTCEANPESLSAALAFALKEAGATRLSLGVQSFCDEELAALGRLHTAARARVAVSEARAAGLNVSVDLMCGIPLQTAASWRDTLEDAVKSGAGHVSVYPLTVEEGTALERLIDRGAFAEPDEDFQARCMEMAREVLFQAGFAPYEVASYARPGKACRHNVAYWTGVPYLGVGRSAASMLDARTYADLRDALGLPEAGAAFGPSGEGVAADAPARLRFTQRGDALPGEDPGPVFDLECLSAREAAAEDLMLGLRMTGGVSAELLARAAAVIPRDALARAVKVACAEGLAFWEDAPAGKGPATGGARLMPTRRGWLLGNELYGLFWDLAAS